MDRIAKGDIPAKITDTYNGDFNEIKNNLNQAIDAVNALVADANMLSKAAVEGKLATRADATKHGGDFRKIVQGVNDTLDAVIGPLNVAAEYVDRISKGDIPPKITDNYNGDFNEIKNNLNQCIDAVNALVADADMLSQGGGGRETGDAGRCDEAPGRLPEDRAGRERHAGRGDRAVERGGGVCGPDLEGRHPGEDHGHLQRRFQRDQEQSEPGDRCGERSGGGCSDAVAGGGGRAARDPCRCDEAPGRLPEDRAGSERHAGRGDQAGAGGVERARGDGDGRSDGPDAGRVPGRSAADQGKHQQGRVVAGRCAAEGERSGECDGECFQPDQFEHGADGCRVRRSRRVRRARWPARWKR